MAIHNPTKQEYPNNGDLYGDRNLTGAFRKGTNTVPGAGHIPGSMTLLSRLVEDPTNYGDPNEPLTIQEKYTNDTEGVAITNPATKIYKSITGAIIDHGNYIEVVGQDFNASMEYAYTGSLTVTATTEAAAQQIPFITELASNNTDILNINDTEHSAFLGYDERYSYASAITVNNTGAQTAKTLYLVTKDADTGTVLTTRTINIPVGWLGTINPEPLVEETIDITGTPINFKLYVYSPDSGLVLTYLKTRIVVGVGASIGIYQPLNQNLTSISALATNVTGLVKTVNGVYSLDTTSYATTTDLSGYLPLTAGATKALQGDLYGGGYDLTGFNVVSANSVNTQYISNNVGNVEFLDNIILNDADPNFYSYITPTAITCHGDNEKKTAGILPTGLFVSSNTSDHRITNVDTALNYKYASGKVASYMKMDANNIEMYTYEDNAALSHSCYLTLNNGGAYLSHKDNLRLRKLYKEIDPTLDPNGYTENEIQQSAYGISFSTNYSNNNYPEDSSSCILSISSVPGYHVGYGDRSQILMSFNGQNLYEFDESRALFNKTINIGKDIYFNYGNAGVIFMQNGSIVGVETIQGYDFNAIKLGSNLDAQGYDITNADVISANSISTDGNTAVKIKPLTGTTDADDVTDVVHGLTYDNIVAVIAEIKTSGGWYMTQTHPLNPFNVAYNDAVVRLENVSVGLQSQLYRIAIIYI